MSKNTNTLQECKHKQPDNSRKPVPAELRRELGSDELGVDEAGDGVVLCEPGAAPTVVDPEAEPLPGGA